MREISIEELVIGSVLSKDLFNDLGNIILSQGTEISDKHIAYFTNHDIRFVYVEAVSDEQSHSNNLAMTYKYKEMNDAYADTIGLFKNLYFRIQNKQFDFDGEELSKSIDPLIDVVLTENDILSSMRILSINESYHFTHAVNVSLLCAMLGKWLDLDKEMIRQVALAGLLHDIGKTQVPQELLFKTTKLHPSEFDQLKLHSRHGYESLKNNPTLSREVLAAILFHHERSDGKGYPSGLKEEQTPYFARIVAVADVFDAITTDKSYSKGVSSFKAFTIIKDESFRGLDPRISDVFLSNIATFFVNNKVKLSDGRIGEVIYINKYALNRPLIKTYNEFVDLSSDYSLEIEEVLI